MFGSIINDKQNKFVLCSMPKGRDLFRRVGARQISVNGSTDAETASEPLPMHMNKIDSLAYMQDYDAMMQAEEYEKARKTAEETEKNVNPSPTE